MSIYFCIYVFWIKRNYEIRASVSRRVFVLLVLPAFVEHSGLHRRGFAIQSLRGVDFQPLFASSFHTRRGFWYSNFCLFYFLVLFVSPIWILFQRFFFPFSSPLSCHFWHFNLSSPKFLLYRSFFFIFQIFFSSFNWQLEFLLDMELVPIIRLLKKSREHPKREISLNFFSVLEKKNTPGQKMNICVRNLFSFYKHSSSFIIP